MSDYGVDVSVGKTGGVFKKILKEGTGAKSPQANSEVALPTVSSSSRLTPALSSGRRALCGNVARRHQVRQQPRPRRPIQIHSRNGQRHQRYAGMLRISFVRADARFQDGMRASRACARASSACSPAPLHSRTGSEARRPKSPRTPPFNSRLS